MSNESKIMAAPIFPGVYSHEETLLMATDLLNRRLKIIEEARQKEVEQHEEELRIVAELLNKQLQMVEEKKKLDEEIAAEQRRDDELIEKFWMTNPPLNSFRFPDGIPPNTPICIDDLPPITVIGFN